MINKDYAIWQYMIDHSTIQGDGAFLIVFCVRDEQDFWRRIKARQEGFKRYDIPKKKKDQMRVSEMFKKLNGYIRYSRIINEKTKKLEKGSPTQRILLFIYRKIKKYLYP